MSEVILLKIPGIIIDEIPVGTPLEVRAALAEIRGGIAVTISFFNNP